MQIEHVLTKKWEDGVYQRKSQIKQERQAWELERGKVTREQWEGKEMTMAVGDKGKTRPVCIRRSWKFRE